MGLNTAVLTTAQRSKESQRIHRRARVGGIILELRTQLGMSLGELAERSGVSQSHLGRIERGMTMPSYSVVADIASALNTDLAFFTRYTDRSSRADYTIQQVLTEAGIAESDQELVFRMSLKAREVLAGMFADAGSPPNA
jgi:transcriptional regulator with XRE-family HTH domain